MSANRRVFVGYVFLLVFLAGCGKKPAPRTAKGTKTIPQSLDNVFLNNFTKGWIYSFLQDETSNYLQEMIAQNPGWQALFDYNLPQAIKAFEKSESTTNQTGLFRALLLKAQIYHDAYEASLLYQKRFLSYRQQNVKLVKPSVYLIFYLGKVKLLSGDYQKAITDLSYFLQKKALPRFLTRAQVLLGAAHYLNGDTKKAQSLWKKAKTESENGIYYKSEWGFVQGYLGRNLNRALLHTRDAWQAVAEKEVEEKSYFLFNLMYLKLLTGQPEEAKRLAEEFNWSAPEYVEYIEPKLSLTFYNPVHLHFLYLLDAARCEEVISKSLNLHYSDFFLGQLYFLKQDYPACEIALQDFISSKPDMDLATAILSPYNSAEDFIITARFILGEVYYLQQQTEKALKLWQETFSLYKTNPLSWLYQAEIEVNYLEQRDNARKTAKIAQASNQSIKNDLYEQSISQLTADEQANFNMLFPFYQLQYQRRPAILLLKEGQISEGLRKLAETTDKNVGYNISSENQPCFLLTLAQAYYQQNRFNEMVGIYFSLLKVFPELKQNYETIKSIYATTTDQGETPR